MYVLSLLIMFLCRLHGSVCVVAHLQKEEVIPDSLIQVSKGSKTDIQSTKPEKQSPGVSQIGVAA